MLDIRPASLEDLDGVAALLQANAPSSGGALTGEFPAAKVAAMLRSDLPAVAALRDGRIVGVLFASSTTQPSPPPPVAAMLRAWPGEPDAYVYGPICVAESERGQGLPARLYAAQRSLLPGREAILFIRRDNAASLRAHLRLGLREVAGFTLAGAAYAVLSGTGHSKS
ncbi:N-acetyltransferase [Chromobacterium violaceum]|uniref:GNAT family N-acetyltransferase n=1 Tax=Chromobacterium violaceum TaxID=536 RepID=UPI0009D958CE|nr:GNAT family N-acetyltransferase [Chromobacterium violaceum]OQS10788.1 N-acetyltransferase [Chromobacterium violaceum]OQS27217.1 N-acetyltransferase [Chromobacterium violaceum]